MKIKCLLLLLITPLILNAQLPPCYELVFEDNFDSSEIDVSKWRSSFPWNQNGKYPDWVCNDVKEQGKFYKMRNFENISLSNGILNIISRKENYLGEIWNWPTCSSDSCIGKTCNYSYDPPKCFDVDSAWHKYTTNMLRTYEKFKYGYFEIKCKLPKPVAPQTNKGIGTNFWMYSGDTSVTWSEIDIFEFNGQYSTFVPNIHYEDIEGDIIHRIRHDNSRFYVDFNTYHRFSTLWRPDSIFFYLDSILICATDIYTDSTQIYPSELIAMPLIIDVYLPTHTMCQTIDTNNTKLPHYFKIDYVRVYQMNCENCNANYNNYCFYDTSEYENYYPVVLGGDSCNYVIPANKSLNLQNASGLKVNNNFTIEKGADFIYNPIPCINNIHYSTKELKSNEKNPAPSSFYERLKPKYHE